ncbi:uncharacterized protein LOC132948097 [Metopolophium dirhodum]|uniref:uncharacterized protein LOC132948097 n=1 Tax=Metopolophium dirhodum TaxID=44670 RepID=UPI0029902DF1|nr:uncharacterized protein LOC132948097 [Metopolophium dirhodum]
MAALVLARMPPVTLQAVGRKRANALRREGAVLTNQQKEDAMIGQWQEMWDVSTKAAWTKELIPDLRRWWSQGPREVSYHMAQALTGHGCFQSYLWRKGKAENPGCVHCPAVFDDAEHTLFACPFCCGGVKESSRSRGRSVPPVRSRPTRAPGTTIATE